ncbi:CARDB domain-containing protein [Haloarchaeobius sp. HME9146]|uniref:CARDB domain-containing protein n=1 Tax=Haloarchaeobius sp. HME9146 TaxID=2978732 RepID=UPI0021BEBAFA|nr:CARDB domain-containing protein [Haloarchaeobius sp. HME9146]MCT9098204.1 hypothetical protein [Haloarchaeobius sp. HME9146]
MTDDRLLAFQDALQRGATGEALDKYDGVETALNEQETTEEGVQVLARAVAQQTDPATQANQTAQQYMRAVTTAQQARLEFNVKFMSFVTDNVEPQTLAESIGAVIEAHETVDSVASKLRERADNVAVRPILAVSAPSQLTVPKGQTFSITVEATNLGTAPTDALDVTVSPDSVGVDPTQLPSLSGGDRVTISVSGRATADQPVPVEVNASNDDIGDTAGSVVTAVSKGDYLIEAIEETDRLLEVVGNLESGAGDDSKNGTKGKQNGGSNGGKSGLENKLETVRKRLEKVKTRVERGQTKSANEKLESVSSLVGTVATQADALGGKQIPEQRAGVVTAEAREIQSIIANSIEANP